MTILKHKKDGAALLIDLTGKIGLLSPSFTLKHTGEFNVGMAEFKERKRDKFSDVFVCPKCLETFEPDSDEIAATCNVCRKDKTISHMFVTASIAQICDKCLEALSNPNAEIKDEKVMDYKQFISLPEKLNPIPMSSILKSKISL